MGCPGPQLRLVQHHVCSRRGEVVPGIPRDRRCSESEVGSFVFASSCSQASLSAVSMLQASFVQCRNVIFAPHWTSSSRLKLLKFFFVIVRARCTSGAAQ